MGAYMPQEVRRGDLFFQINCMLRITCSNPIIPKKNKVTGSKKQSIYPNLAANRKNLAEDILSSELLIELRCT